MGKYADVCKRILKFHGPLIGSELIQFLINEIGVSNTNARQIIHRLKDSGDICSTEPVSFMKNQYLYFLSGQNINDKIKQILPDFAITYNRLYLAFLELDGFLLWTEFLKITAGALDNTNGHKTAYEILEDLKTLGLIKPIKHFSNSIIIIADESWVPSVNASDSNIYKRLKDQKITEQLTSDLLKWLERTNIAGWNSTYIHTDDEDKGINGFYWDAHGFSYLWGLYSTIKDPLFKSGNMKKGSLILIDSILTRKMQLFDINGFISRIQIQYGRITNAKNYRIIPVCFVQYMEPEVLNLAKSKGILVITLYEVFGSRILEIIDSVRKIDPRNIDPTSLAKIIAIADQTGQEGKFNSIKGYLFNFLVASIFNAFGWEPRIGVKYKANEKKCECDVVINTADDLLIICECKGISNDKYIELGESEEDPDSVKKFFERTLSIVKNDTRNTNVEDIIPVFITSGSFTPEALEYLNKKNNSKRIDRLTERIGRFPNQVYYDYNQLIELFLSNTKKFATHKQVLDEFYKTRTEKNNERNTLKTTR